MSNIFKTAMLLAVLTAMLVLIGGAFGGRQGMLMAFVLALLMNLGSYWFSDKIVLAMYGAQPIDEAQAPGLYAIVRRLTTRAGLPMPRVYLIPTDTPNAFATGRNPHHAAVAVTEGIMRILNDEELEGVLAHELAHVKNRDVLISTIAATLAGAITYLAHMAQWAAMFGGRSSDDEERGGNPLGLILMAVLAPLAAMLVQLAVSRAREFQADPREARARQRGRADGGQPLDRAPVHREPARQERADAALLDAPAHRGAGRAPPSDADLVESEGASTAPSETPGIRLRRQSRRSKRSHSDMLVGGAQAGPSPPDRESHR